MSTFVIKYHDGLYAYSKSISITEEEEKEIIALLESKGLKPETLEFKSFDIDSFVIGGFTFYLIGHYALDPLFGEIDKKIKELLLKNSKRKAMLENFNKEKRQS